MDSTTRSITIHFDSEVLSMIHKEADRNGQTVSEFMKTAVLEKLEDCLDYQDALNSIRESNGRSFSRDEVKRELQF